jgi:hypothetical protein
MDNKNALQNAKEFKCDLCDFICFKLSDWKRHILRPKHIKRQNDDKNVIICEEKTPKNADCNICKCGNIYKNYSSLWRHKKTCNQVINLEKEEENIILEKEEKDNSKDALIEYLINENKEFKNLILEVCKNLPGNNISNNNCNNINTNTNNSNNKTFNLQFFLNETCKDAMNMSEFINSLTLQLSDLESVGKLGFVDGISNIIIKNLKALDVEKRPVHCCDAKRETMYIKDHDKWEKEDNELKQMRELVRYVRDKNISMVNTWRDMYPECVKSDSKKTTQYNQIYMEAFGGETGGEKGTKNEKEEKIISRIAKSVVIEK